MRRMTYIKAVLQYYKPVLKALRRGGRSKDTAEDALQESVTSVLANQSYARIETDRVDGYMFRYIRNGARNSMRNKMREVNREKEQFTPYVSSEEFTMKMQSLTGTFHYVERDSFRDPAECPFCHTENALNQFGACGICHTIMPQGKTEHDAFRLEDVEPISEGDLDCHVDIQRALEQLAPTERKVIEAVILNRETLEELAAQADISPASMCRVYAKAKAKLEDVLLEYAFLG